MHPSDKPNIVTEGWGRATYKVKMRADKGETHPTETTPQRNNTNCIYKNTSPW